MSVVDLWASAANVVAEAGTPDYKNLGFPSFSGDGGMTDHIEDFLMPAAQDLINTYLHRSYTSSDAPPAVVHCAMKVAANGLLKIGIRKKGGLIQSSQWMVELSDATIFTPELKAEIQDFMLGAENLSGRTSHTSVSPYKTREIKRRWGEEDGD